MLNVLIACEESQRVCIEMRKLGHRAFSCDILECSGGHPEWHIQGDVLPLLNGDCTFQTMDGHAHIQRGRWDLIIAHPPCTYLTLAGNKWLKPEFEKRFPERKKQRQEAIDFFMQFANANCKHIAIENPVGVMSSKYRKPDQYIEPFWFGDAEKKKNGFVAERTSKTLPNEHGGTRNYSLRFWRKRTTLAHGNNETSKGRTLKAQKQDLPWHRSCYG